LLRAHVKGKKVISPQPLRAALDKDRTLCALRCRNRPYFLASLKYTQLGGRLRFALQKMELLRS
jgi:hypothetical protein